MKVTVLGSGGFGYPLVFCGCENCNKARIVGGKNIRKRASISRCPSGYKLVLRFYKILHPNVLPGSATSSAQYNLCNWQAASLYQT